MMESQESSNAIVAPVFSIDSTSILRQLHHSILARCLLVIRLTQTLNVLHNIRAIGFLLQVPVQFLSLEDVKVKREAPCDDKADEWDEESFLDADIISRETEKGRK